MSCCREWQQALSAMSILPPSLIPSFSSSLPPQYPVEGASLPAGERRIGWGPPLACHPGGSRLLFYTPAFSYCFCCLQRKVRRRMSSIPGGIQKVASRWHKGPQGKETSSVSSKAKARILQGKKSTLYLNISRTLGFRKIKDISGDTWLVFTVLQFLASRFLRKWMETMLLQSVCMSASLYYIRQEFNTSSRMPSTRQRKQKLSVLCHCSVNLAF